MNISDPKCTFPPGNSVVTSHGARAIIFIFLQLYNYLNNIFYVVQQAIVSIQSHFEYSNILQIYYSCKSVKNHFKKYMNINFWSIL